MKSLGILASLLLTLSPSVSAWKKVCPHPPPPCNTIPTFTLSNITYYSYLIYSTPAHLAVSQGSVNFTLTNSATSSSVFCAANSGQPFAFFSGNIIYNCTSGPDSPTFEYTTTDLFQVNATWTCNGPPQKWVCCVLYLCWSNHLCNSKTYLGYGTGTANLSCVNTDQITPNWTLGEIYQYETTTCTGPDLVIYPTVIQEWKTKTWSLWSLLVL